MQLRNDPRMIGQWPPRLRGGSSYAGADTLPIRSELAERAVVLSVRDRPPIPPSTGPRGVILITDQGVAIIATLDTIFRHHLFQKLQAYLPTHPKPSLRAIGDLEIDF